jgi:hypothetical protein
VTRDGVLEQHVHNHFGTFKLAALYASEAAEELLNIRLQLHRLHDAAGPDNVRLHLRDRAQNCRLARLNDWRAAGL